MNIKFVVATRESSDSFYANTATGRSLAFYQSPQIEICLFPENSLGLSKIYNSVIESCLASPSLLIFMHDDVHLIDYHWMDALANALQVFSIVGVCGNKRRVPFQPSWAFPDLTLQFDAQENLSGLIGHGKCFPPDDLSFFGPPMQQVMLLDGVMLAAFSETLIRSYIRFDEKFDFHFYDMDICRQAEIRGLSCGTAAISLIHESGGNFGSPSWKNSYDAYIQKWGQ